ncbi:uncharacterized protein LOC135476965 [Liolophura sinensis]|uniref:uncharacterized protein LOC135476965 n=1 Tax=Liolophura sinensis TaxID=3198878 RepID=UPI0031597457
MSMKSLRVRRVFLFSGLSDDVREDLARKVAQLGGVYLKDQEFKPNCTHVICGKLSRGEKFLGACAMGKWILVPDYVTSSAKAKEWLSEELYEWGPRWAKKGDYSEEMLSAPSKWRHHHTETKQGAFAGWKVSLLVESAKRKTVYRRLLLDGGGKVYKLPPLPTAAHNLSRVLTHVFVQPDDNDALMNLLKEGFHCYSPNYIGDYLIKGPTGASPVTSDKECGVKPGRHDIRCRSTYSAGTKETTKCGKQLRSIVKEEVGEPIGTKRRGVRGVAKGELSQRSMDQYCISSPRPGSQQSCLSSSQGSYDSTPTQSQFSSPQPSKQSKGCCSPSLLNPAGVSVRWFQCTSEAEPSTKQTSDKCSDVFTSHDDDDIVFLKVVPAKSSASGMNSLAVSTQLSPLARATTISQENSQLRSRDSDRKHRCSVLDSDLCVINREKFAIDTSDCLGSSFQDLTSVMFQRVLQRPTSEVSESSMKAVAGSSTAASVSSLSEFSSRMFSSVSVYSNQSGSLNANNTVKLRRSSRMAARSSRYSASSSNSRSPLKQFSTTCDDDKMPVCKKKSTVKLEPETSSLSKSQPGSSPLTSRRCCLPLDQKSSCMQEISSNCRGSTERKSDSSNHGGDSLPDVELLGVRVTRSSHRSQLSCMSDEHLQYPVSSGLIPTRSSCCFLATESQFNQEMTSHSSEEFTYLSNICRDSSSMSDRKGTSDLTTSTTSPSCFYNKNNSKSGSETNGAMLILSSPCRRSPRNSSSIASSGTVSTEIKEKLFTEQSRSEVDISASTVVENPRICSKTANPCLPVGLPSTERTHVSHVQVKTSATSSKTSSCQTLSSPCDNLAVKPVKRKTFRDLDLDDVFGSRRKKAKRDPNLWQPSVFGVRCKQALHPPNDSTKKRCLNTSVSMPMTDASLGIIETCLEGNYVISALDILSSNTSSKIYPPPHMLHRIMTLMLRVRLISAPL